MTRRLVPFIVDADSRVRGVASVRAGDRLADRSRAHVHPVRRQAHDGVHGAWPVREDDRHGGVGRQERVVGGRGHRDRRGVDRHARAGPGQHLARPSVPERGEVSDDHVHVNEGRTDGPGDGEGDGRSHHPRRHATGGARRGGTVRAGEGPDQRDARRRDGDHEDQPQGLRPDLQQAARGGGAVVSDVVAITIDVEIVRAGGAK